MTGVEFNHTGKFYCYYCHFCCCCSRRSSNSDKNPKCLCNIHVPVMRVSMRGGGSFDGWELNFWLFDGKPHPLFQNWPLTPKSKFSYDLIKRKAHQ